MVSLRKKLKNNSSKTDILDLSVFANFIYAFQLIRLRETRKKLFWSVSDQHLSR